MRVHRPTKDVSAPKTLPKKSEYASPDDFLLARLKFIRADSNIAESDKFVLRLGAAFEHHRMTFNKLYRLLKEKQKQQREGGCSATDVFGWPEVLLGALYGATLANY